MSVNRFNRVGSELPTRAARIAAQSVAHAEKQATLKREAAERRAERARAAESEATGSPAPPSHPPRGTGRAI